MELGEIRRERLRRICEAAPFKGNRAMLADALERAPSIVSRLIGGSKGIGERMARHIEESLGLARYSLDMPLEGRSAKDPLPRNLIPVTPALLIAQMQAPLVPLGIKLEDVLDVQALAERLDAAMHGVTAKPVRNAARKAGAAGSRAGQRKTRPGT